MSCIKRCGCHVDDDLCNCKDELIIEKLKVNVMKLAAELRKHIPRGHSPIEFPDCECEHCVARNRMLALLSEVDK